MVSHLAEKRKCDESHVRRLENEGLDEEQEALLSTTEHHEPPQVK